MNWWNKLLVAGYVSGTWPYRCVANAQAARRGRAPVMVLFYHRIADEHPNAWTMSNATFTRQIDWLQRWFDLISLEEAQRRIRHGNHRPAVSITFDDGYGDNCHHALPLLIERRIPGTYFVSTGHVLEGKPFPHDVACGRPLRPNTSDELRSLAAAGIEIGAHTRTHADLGHITDRDVLYDEVVAAARDLEAIVDRPVRNFAFPYGLPANLSQPAIQLARQHGFDAVCSAYGGYNVPGDDPFHLQRIHADVDFIRLKNWLTVDPRKRFVKRFPSEQLAPVPSQRVTVA